jgi:hypothetical protein
LESFSVPRRSYEQATESNYRRLYIRRGDLRAAAAVLKKSNARFASIEESLATSEASNGTAVRGEDEAGVV